MMSSRLETVCVCVTHALLIGVSTRLDLQTSVLHSRTQDHRFLIFCNFFSLPERPLSLDSSRHTCKRMKFHNRTWLSSLYAFASRVLIAVSNTAYQYGREKIQPGSFLHAATQAETRPSSPWPGPALIFLRPGVKPQSGALYTCMTLTVLNVNTYI